MKSSIRLSFVCTIVILLGIVFPMHRAAAEDLTVGSAGLTLSADATYANVSVGSGGALDLSGFTLTATGGVTVNGGTLDVNGGTLKVAGNLDITGMNGWLKMIKVTDTVEVTGNVTFNGAASNNYLTAGTLRAGGHFYQKGTYYSASSGPVEMNNRNSFTASGTHKVVLNGSGRQDISFEFASDVNSHFQDLVIEKPAATINTIFSDDGEALISDNFTPSGTWGIGTTAYEGKGAWSDSPTGNYPDNANPTGNVTASLTSKTMILANTQGVYLSFAQRYDVEQNYDYCKVEISTDDGATWTEAASFTGKQEAWDVKILDLSSYAGQGSFRFRFFIRSNAAGNAAGWQIDRIRLYTVTGSPIRFTGNIYATGQWALNADTVIMSNNALTLSDTSLNPAGHTIAVPFDLTINGNTDLNGGTLLTAGNLTFNSPLVLHGGSLSVGGNMTVASTFDLEGKTLTIPGNLTISGSGLFYVNGGRCVVGGNLTVESGNTYLKMVNPTDEVEVGGNAYFRGHATNWVDGQTVNAYLSAGTLRVKGDFTQQYNYSIGSPFTFRATGTHKVILNGTAKQTVSFQYPSDSYFQNLEIANTSAEGVVFTSPITVAGTFSYASGTTLSFSAISSFGLTISHDQTITGDLTVNGPLDLAGHALTVSGNLTLNSSLVLHGGSLSVGGNMTVASTFDLEGKTLTIPGDLAISGSGLFYVNGGRCVVGGNLTVESGNTYLKMVNPTDEVEVGGNAYFRGHATNWVDGQTVNAYLSAGTLRVKGDFTQQYNYSIGSPFTFRATGTHKVILNGTAKQTVSFQYPSDSYFQNLEIANTSAEGVVFTSPITVAGTFSYASGTTLSFSAISSFGLTISHDQTITGDLTANGPLDLAGHALTVSGNLTLNSSLVLHGGSLSVGGNMTVASTFDLEGKTLTIPGDLTISGSGLFYVNGGRCVVGGNLTVESGNTYLKMVNPTDEVEVGGNAYFRGHATNWVDGQTVNAYLSAGTLRVKGDFTQQYNYSIGSPFTFRATGTHKVILNGTAKQTVSFQYPSDSYFQNLEIANISAEGVVCIPDKRVIVMGTLTITSGTVTGLDHSPRITSLLTNASWFRDLPNTYQVTVDDPDLLDPSFGEQLSITVDPDSIIKGIKVTSSGLLYWTPTREQVGQHTITVIVTDKYGAQGRQDLIITVAHPLFESAGNDTQALATPILISNKPVKADLTVANGTAADVDYYKITLSADRKIRVILTTFGSNKYLLEVLDGLGTALGTIHLTGSSTQPVEKNLDLGLPAGNYYFKVRADQASYNAAQVYGVGYLDLESFTPPEQTKTATFGTAYQDALLTAQDRRYYQFSLAEAGAISISYTNPGQSDYLFLLKDSSGNIVETFRLLAGLDLNSKINLAAGAYTLAIESAGYLDATQIFTLTFTSSASDGGVEKEPNDTLTQANAVDVAKTMRGRISDDMDADYYKLSLSTTKMLDFVFKTAQSAAGHYSLDILIGETVINHITVPGSGASSTLSAGLFPGDYYLKVTGTGVSSSDDYTIDITEATGADREIEGNNTKAFANGLTNLNVKQARLHSDKDVDFFGVTYSDYDYFGVTIKPVTQGTNFRVQVLDGEDNTLKDFTTQGSAEAIGELYLWPGNYYVKVTGAQEGDYTLRYEGAGVALKELVKLAILEAPQRIEVSNQASLKLVGSYTDGSVIDLSTAQATWTSSDPGKAVVSGNAVSGIAAGPVTIFANYGGQMAKADLDIGAASVQKKQNYGNLILVAGGGVAVTNTLRDSTQYLANTTYNRFMGRGFRMEDIFYFNPIPWQDINGDGYGDPVVTEKLPTVAELRSAIETWAVNQPSTGPLYLVLIDHGGIDTFEVFPGEIITAAQLDASLSAFEAATGRNVAVMIEACKSGSFVSDLAKTGSRRLVITSTNEGNAYLDLQGRVSFTQFFMDQLYSGNTFRESYLKTTQKLANIGTPYSMMAPQLAEGQANTLSQTRLGGNFVIAGLFPEIKSQTPDKSVSANTPQTFSVTIDDLTGKTRVWAVVTPPDYFAPAVVGDLQAPQVALPTLDLADEVNGQIDGVYTGTYTDFLYNGVYRVVFYARNADGLVVDSPPTLITVTGGQNAPSKLTVTKTGTGDGTVTSDSPGIACGTDCSETYSTATTIILTAAPDSYSDFAGWTGTGIACPGTGRCTALVDGATSVNANFTRKLLKGDLNNDGALTLADAILALKIIGGLNPAGIRTDYVTSGADVTGDGKIGMAEVIYILQKVAAIR